jgi:hypothetical protein
MQPESMQEWLFFYLQGKLKPKLLRRDKECHFTLIKGTIHQADVTIVNIYVPNISIPNFIKQTLLDIEAQLDLNKIIRGNFTSPPFN